MDDTRNGAEADLIAVYRVRCPAGRIEARAREIAVEQSVEMPVAAIDDDYVTAHVVGRVLDIAGGEDGTFSVRVALAAETVGGGAGQLVNMLYGNTSIHDDVTLEDAELPSRLIAGFGGPNLGLDGLRARVGAGRRALTSSALKPQGLPAEGLADIARRLALGGIDYIKDDHGLADQAFSPFAARVAAVAAAVREANAATGRRAQYVPSLSGNLDDMGRQIAVGRAHGIGTFLIAPMIAGLSTFHALARANPDLGFIAHPALAGASRIAPRFHFGKLFRMLGADGVIYPNHGGRFGYSAATCREIADAATAPWQGLRAAVPVPAGGMTLERVPEILAFYGSDAMLLIGGSLLAARERMTQEAAQFVRAVEEHTR